MTQFALVTHWHLDAPIDRVWDALVAVETWPQWWRYVCKVDELQQGGAEGLGALRRYTWASRLPYRLTFQMRISAVERPTLIEGTAEGDLSGTGRWRLVPDDATTRVRYDWTVAVTKAWDEAVFTDPRARFPVEPQRGDGGGRKRPRAPPGRPLAWNVLIAEVLTAARASFTVALRIAQ